MGVQSVTPVPIVSGSGVREFHRRDPDGHMFRVGAGLEATEAPATPGS